MEGWIKLHRKIEESYIWQTTEPYDRRSAWVDLLLIANHTEKEMIFNGQNIVIKRGQVLTSTRKLSEKWKWSINKIYRYINALEKRNMLIKESDNNRTLLTIVNYGFYQCGWNSDGYSDEYTNGYSDGYSKRTVTDTLTDTVTDTVTEHKQEIKNNKNVKNVKKENNIMPVFPVDNIPKPKNNDPHKEERERIIEYLNIKCGTRYRPNSKTTVEYVNGRFNDGFSEVDFYTVIDKKSAEWIGTNLEQYLTPTTLFAVSKFEKYLNQKIVTESNQYKPSSRNEQFDKLMEQIRMDENGY